MSDERWDNLNRQSEYAWEKVIGKPLGKLKLASAYLARIDTIRDAEMRTERTDWLKERVGGLLREADPAAVLADLECWRLVLRLFSAAGLRRLELRSKESIAKAVA